PSSIPPTSHFSLFLFYSSAAHPDLHSFPTRRSSDLRDRGSLRRLGAAYRRVGTDHRLRPEGEQIGESDRGDDRGRDRNQPPVEEDRKSTRLNSSHLVISYAVFCLKKKKKKIKITINHNTKIAAMVKITTGLTLIRT